MNDMLDEKTRSEAGPRPLTVLALFILAILVIGGLLFFAATKGRLS